MSQGLSFLSGYTWAKSINNQEGEEGGYSDNNAGLGQNDNNPGGDRGRGANDARHRFTIGYTWELPFGKGRKWVDQGGVANAAVGGWKLSGSTSLQTGFPFTPSTSVDVANVGTGAWRPGRVCNGSRPPSQRTVERWFDATCFTDQFLLADLAAGHPRFGNSGRSILDGPGFQNWDFAFLKDFPIGERFKIQFRAEFFNAFNQAHFHDPTTDITDSAVGQIFGANEPRDIQVALKFLF